MTNKVSQKVGSIKKNIKHKKPIIFVVVGIHKKTFCDGAHVEKHFTDNEVATKEPYIKQSRGLKVKKLIY